jgi:hypothetical protein
MAERDVDRFVAALGSEFYADDAAIRQHSSVNLIHQPSGGEAKPYQIRQVLRLIERYNLKLEDAS